MRLFKIQPSILWLFLLLDSSFEGAAADYAVGADLSFLKQAEDRGVVFCDGTNARPALRIFKDHGFNWVRLRLFHSPTNLPNNLEYTLAAAKAAHEQGFKFLLDFHYSDTWADPAKQHPPAAWRGKSHVELVQAVHDYTRETIESFGRAGMIPDLVQIGNEVSAGMLWPDGKLPEHWDNFAELLKAGLQGVRDGCGTNAPPRLMIHLDRGGSRARTKYFFDQLLSRGVNFDVIGQSYYPWWHGSLLDLRDNLDFMARTYQKDIMLVEVAYCWRPTQYQNRPGPFPESPEGQRQFLEEVNRLVLGAPDHRGAGVFWWEPAVEPGRLRSRGLFDDSGKALPAMEVFDRWTRR